MITHEAELLTLPAGTVIHVCGWPVYLTNETQVHGHPGTIELVRKDLYRRLMDEAQTPAGGAALSASPVPQLPDVEVVAAAVHDAWMDQKRAKGITSAPSQTTGEEQMRPYAELSNEVQEYDRATVRAVYAAMATSASPVSIPPPPTPEWQSMVERVAASLGPVIGDLERLDKPKPRGVVSAIYVLGNLKRSLEALLPAPPPRG